MKRLIAILFLLSLLANRSLAQSDTVYIEKRECVTEDVYKGYKLVIHFTKDSSNLKAKVYDYYLDFLQGINDKIKLDLIGKLLSYEDDTSMCCLKVYAYSFNGNEGCRGASGGIDRYTLQVDALFMINRLVWPKLMELYSCSPVLYDNKLMKEINSDPEKIKCVFKEYKKWYEDCMAKGKIDRYFPFNDGRYVWYGGRKSIVPKD